MAIGYLTLEIYLKHATSLKQKRSLLKPLITRLHRDFNVSVAEIDHQDTWHSSLLEVAIVNNDPTHAVQVLQTIPPFIARQFPEVEILAEKIELI